MGTSSVLLGRANLRIWFRVVAVCICYLCILDQSENLTWRRRADWFEGIYLEWLDVYRGKRRDHWIGLHDLEKNGILRDRGGGRLCIVDGCGGH